MYCKKLLSGPICTCSYWGGGAAEQVRGRLTVQSLEGTHRYRGIVHATSVIVREVREGNNRKRFH